MSGLKLLGILTFGLLTCVWYVFASTDNNTKACTLQCGERVSTVVDYVCFCAKGGGVFDAYPKYLDPNWNKQLHK